MRMYVVLLLLLAALVACGGETEPPVVDGEIGSAVSAALPTATATTPPIAGGGAGGGGGSVPPTAEPPIEQPTATAEPTAEPTGTAVPILEPTATPTATPEPEGNDDCLVGTWRITNFNEYMRAILNDAFAQAGSPIAMDVAVSSAGDLLLSFDGEVARFRDNNFSVTVSVMGQQVATNIDATGEATYTAAEGVFLAQVGEVSVTESSQGFGVNFQDVAGEPVAYECGGNDLLWALPQMPVPLTLVRVP